MTACLICHPSMSWLKPACFVDGAWREAIVSLYIPQLLVVLRVEREQDKLHNKQEGAVFKPGIQG